VTLRIDLAGSVGSLALRAAFETSPGPVVLTGPNGSGKTSLLLMILGVLAPERGSVTLDGVPLFDAERGVNVAVEHRSIGYVPQNYGLFPHLTAVGNVEFALACHKPGLPRREARERALSLLAELGLAELAAQRPHALSAGERQRVALARAMASEPKALLLDEPFAALDVGTRRQVRLFLRAYLERLGLPTVVVSHDAEDARAVGHRIAVIEGGRVVQAGSWNELKSEPASAFVRELTL
jgi:molybdate transport system ATP-binding protein